MIHTFLLRCALLSALFAPASALAAFITVNTLDDEANADGDCSLREAIQSANQNTAFDSCTAGDSIGTDSIFIGVTGTINLGNAIQITERVDLFGAGRDSLTISGQGASSIFIINAPDDTHDVEIRLLTLADGSEAVPGAALWIQRGGTIRLEQLRVAGNQTNGDAPGGAIAVQLPVESEDITRLEVIRSRFENNSAAGRGGAIYLAGFPGQEPLDSLLIEESSFIGNSAGLSGGVIYADDVRAIAIDRSVFSGNIAEGTSNGAIAGGALSLRSSDLVRITSSTFDDNNADSGGGAISAISGSVLIVENSTFTGNYSGSNFGNAVHLRFDTTASVFFSTLVGNDLSGRPTDSVFSIGESSTLSLGHSIVWTEGSESEPECKLTSTDSVFNSLGFNIDTSGTCTGHADDLPMTDPNLSMLDDFGDDTSWAMLETFLPLSGSPAIDGGSVGPCAGAFGATLATDQRGQTRAIDGDASGEAQCDIGAVEFQPADNPVIFSDRFEGSP
ncbi:CSLREA domain-containing protein [Wenzhouxiangella sediminis]|nr:CSLREA domain-containing protein [Wenzhouxiangella sediminis]